MEKIKGPFIKVSIIPQDIGHPDFDAAMAQAYADQKIAMNAHLIKAALGDCIKIMQAHKCPIPASTLVVYLDSEEL